MTQPPIPSLLAAVPRSASITVDLCADYGLNDGDDITAALQSALNLAGTGASSLDIILRGRRFTLNGAVQTGTALGYTYNGQVLLPAVPVGQGVAVRIRGVAPGFHGGSVHPFGATKIVSNMNTVGAWMIDAIPSFNQFGAVNPWTNVHIMLEELVFQGPNDPQGGVLNALTCSAVWARRVYIGTAEIGGSFAASYTRTGTTEAIVLPQNLNDGNIVINDCVVRNWGYAIRLSEHATIINTRIATCTSAFTANADSGHANDVRANVENCLHVFHYTGTTGSCRINAYIDTEGQNGGVDLVRQPARDRFVGKIDWYDVQGGSRGYVSTSSTTGVNSRLGSLNIAALHRGSASYRARWPLDNFFRQGVMTVPGLTWPSLHPWWTQVGSWQVTTSGQSGYLASTNGTSFSEALVQSELSQFKSRRIATTVVLGASFHHRIVANYVMGGSNVGHSISLDVGGSANYIAIVGFLETGATATLASANVTMNAGETHTFALDVVVDANGTPDLIIGYVDAVEVLRYKLTAANKAALAVNPIYLQEGDDAALADGLGQYEAASHVTAFSVMPLAVSSTIARKATVSLAAGTTTVADARITATSIVRVSNVSAGGTAGALSVALNSGVGFTINSSSSSDTSKVFYEIVSY